MDVVEVKHENEDDDEEVLKLYPSTHFKFKFIYDITKKEIIKNCELMPTDLPLEEKLIFAANNKYPLEEIKEQEQGKWMMFPKRVHINCIWDKLKQGIMNGRLWKVYASNESDNKGSHLVMVYTKNFADIDDVIETLDYIESSGIKPPDVGVIKYKTEKQSMHGVYAVFGQKSSIYDSDSIRDGVSYNYNSEGFWYYSHLGGDTAILDCTKKPTEVLRTDSLYLFARNDAYGGAGLFYHDGDELNRKKFGKWVIKTSDARVNAIWDKIKDSIIKGYFWFAEVSTKDPKNPKHQILIFNADYTDIDEIVAVLDNIEALELANLSSFNITYESLRKQDDESGTRLPHMVSYSSSNIRNLAMDLSKRNNEKDGYSFIYDVHTKEIISSGFLKPSEVLTKEYRYMFSKNNKYNENNIDYREVGCWKICLPNCLVDKVWKSVKEETEKGNLWYSKLTHLTAILECEMEDMEFGLFVYTQDANDVEDVIKVLNFLEITGIKPKNSSAINYYKNKPVSLLEPCLENTKSSLYSSDNIRLLPYKQYHKRTVSPKPTTSNSDNWRSRRNTPDTGGTKSPVLSWRLRN